MNSADALAVARRDPSVRGFKLLAVAYIVTALAYNLVTPLFEAPDEHTHYFFAQHLAYGGGLPIQPLDRSLRGPWEQEGSQPPLYHVLVAGIIRATGAKLEVGDLWYNDQNTMGDPARRGNENRFIHPPGVEAWPWRGIAPAVHLARGLSMLLGLCVVVAVWSLAGRVFVARPALSLAAAALVALNPQFLAMTSAVTNDNLIAALAAVTLALVLAVADGKASRPAQAVLVLAAALAPLAKLSGLVLAAFAVLTLLFLGSRWGAAYQRSTQRPARPGDAPPVDALSADAQLNGVTRTEIIRRQLAARYLAVLVVAATVLLSGWWYLRNWRLYGEPLGTSRMLVTHGRAFRLDRWLAGLPDELAGVWYSSWGLFGWFTIMLPPAIYALITTLAVLGVAGLIRLVAPPSRDPSKPWIRPRRLAWLGGWGLLVAVGLLRWLMMAKGGQGRLLFPALATLAVALVAGWRSMLPARVSDSTLLRGVVAVMLFLSGYALFGVLGPAFAPAPGVAAASVPASARRADANFDGRLRLVAAEVPERVVEGDAFPITLYWQATAPITREGYVAIRFDQRVAAPTPPVWPPPATSPSAVAPAALGDPALQLTTVSSQAQLSYLAGGNTPPSLLEPGNPVYVDRRWLTAPPLASPEVRPPPDAGLRSPVAARLSIHLYDQTRAERWPAGVAGAAPEASEWATSVVITPQPSAQGPSGRVLAVLWDLVRVVTKPVADRRLPPGYEVAARFANGIVLWRPVESDRGGVAAPAGNGLPSAETGSPSAGRGAPSAGAAPAILPVIWQAGEDISDDLTMFVHVVDAAGTRVDGFDGPPASLAEFPTSRWRRGDLIPAEVRWRWPITAVSTLGLRVGLYRAADGARIPAVRDDGGEWVDGAVDLVQLGRHRTTEREN